LNKKQVQSLISLLDDEDEEVYLHVHDKICNIGFEIKPQLELAWFKASDGILRERIENIIQHLKRKQTLEKISTWINSDHENVLDVLIFFAEHKYDIDIAQINLFVEELRMEAWMNMSYNLNYAQQIKILNTVLYEQYNINKTGKIQVEQYFATHLNYINNIIQHKTASSALMSMLYLYIAQQLNIPVRGVQLKNHLVLTCLNAKNEVLFYINPFNKGLILTRNDISMFLERSKLEPQTQFFTPCNNIDFVKSYFDFVYFCYVKAGDAENASFLKEILSLFEKNEIV
jgi:regulator of sirC expression with transglutaminase-like and TPR domain